MLAKILERRAVLNEKPVRANANNAYDLDQAVDPHGFHFAQPLKRFDDAARRMAWVIYTKAENPTDKNRVRVKQRCMWATCSGGMCLWVTTRHM